MRREWYNVALIRLRLRNLDHNRFGGHPRLNAVTIQGGNHILRSVR